MPFCHFFLALNFSELDNFQLLKSANFIKIKFIASECAKMADFALLEYPKLISRKIWVMEKIMLCPHCVLSAVCLQFGLTCMKRIERFCGDNPLVSIVSLGFFLRLAGGRGQMRAFWPHTWGRWGHYRWNGWIISWKFSWSVATVKASRDKLVVIFDQSVIFGIVVVLMLMVHTVVEMLLLLLFLENHWTRTEKINNN